MDAPVGLRERKRIATRRSIQRAVLSLSAARGFENVTVEDISREADIAPRTFFNYFPTKEAALLGEMPMVPSDEAVARFESGGPNGALFTDLGALLADQFANFSGDRELHELRHSVFKDSPQLSKMHFANMREMEARFGDLIRRRLDADAQRRGRTVVDADAELLAAIAGATMRSAFMSWTRNADETPIAERIRWAFTNVNRVIDEYR